jgi:hypothetical protein
MLSCRRVVAALILAACTWAAHSAQAADFYVDNREGDNIFDGRSPQQVDLYSGPVKTIRRALEKCRGWDTIHIVNNGIPYHESLEIVGPRFRGLRIEGNGAVLSGVKEVPFAAWKFLGNGVWKFTPRRKAFYQLVSGDRALPESSVPATATTLPEIPPGHWAGWHGSIYYRIEPVPTGSPVDAPFLFAAEEVGITFLDAYDVVILDLEFRHFRLDGINVHDRSQDIILDRVKLIENGRAGLAVGGNSLVGIRNSEITGNRLAQVLNAEFAQTELLSTKLESATAPLVRKTGGHVLIEGEEYRK